MIRVKTENESFDGGYDFELQDEAEEYIKSMVGLGYTVEVYEYEPKLIRTIEPEGKKYAVKLESRHTLEPEFRANSKEEAVEMALKTYPGCIFLSVVEKA